MICAGVRQVVPLAALRLLVVAVSCAGGLGCVTQDMWKALENRPTSIPRVMDTCRTIDGRVTAVAVTYTAERGVETGRLVVPYDSDGRPSSPWRADAVPRPPPEAMDGMPRSLPRKQHAEVLRKSDLRPVRSRGLPPVAGGVWIRVRERNHIVPTYITEVRSRARPTPHTRLLYYDAHLTSHDPGNRSYEPFADHAEVILVPARYDDGAAHAKQVGRVVLTVAATPFTLAYDAVVTPVYLVLFGLHASR